MAGRRRAVEIGGFSEGALLSKTFIVAPQRVSFHTLRPTCTILGAYGQDLWRGHSDTTPHGVTREAPRVINNIYSFNQLYLYCDTSFPLSFILYTPPFDAEICHAYLQNVAR